MKRREGKYLMFKGQKLILGPAGIIETRLKVKKISSRLMFYPDGS